MTKRALLGILTPSSNTILEPISQAMVAGLPEVSVLFSRFKVTEIALSASALAQFDDGETRTAFWQTTAHWGSPVGASVISDFKTIFRSQRLPGSGSST
jgi:maleate cis-trans isomerase